MMHYREGRKEDAAALLELIEVALGVHGLQLEVDGADLDVSNVEAYYFHNGGWFQVVEDAGRLIGSVGVYKLSDTQCELRKMYLYPEYQGKKIGKQLMDNALDAARALGFKEMLLQTSSKLSKALPLYEKYGFVEDRDGEVCSRCDIAMIRQL
ncbi:MAG: GNAT family N-acetyltransferase [Cellulosilyticaceae bacterium]